MMNIDAPDEQQCMVSAYCSSERPLKAVSGISQGQLLRDHAVESVDLLGIDYEGGEYEILENTPARCAQSHPAYRAVEWCSTDGASK
jgi:hypothetical protein